MEGRKKESKPCYKRELSIYERETLKRIEEFRTARSNWIADAGSQMHLKVNESLKDSQAYQDRDEYTTFYEDDSKLDTSGSRTQMRGLKFFKKFKITTKNMRLHYKTLRPLRYYTLRPQLPYTDEIDTPTEKQEKPEKKKEKFTCSDLELWPTEEPPANLKMKPGKKKKLKRKKAKCKELLLPVPCRHALKKLKAAKIEEHMIESCRCDDGKEVTVVIKGICLCDKNSLNKLKLDKVCDKYSQMVSPPDKDTTQAQEKDLPPSEGQKNLEQKVEPKLKDTKAQKINEEPISDELAAIRAASSRDIHKKRITIRRERKASKQQETSQAKSKKAVEFDKEEYNKPEEKRKIPDSDLTIYPRFSINSSDSITEHPDDTKMKTEKLEKINETELLKTKPEKLEKINKTELLKTKPEKLEKINETELLKTKPEKDMPKKQNVSEVTEIVRDDDVNRTNQDTKTKKETNTKDLGRDGANNENASTITLYKNKPEKESDFALTREQMEVIKQNENKKK